MMNTEELLKLKCQAVSSTVNFVRGFLNEEEEEEENKQPKKIMELYS